MDTLQNAITWIRLYMSILRKSWRGCVDLNPQILLTQCGCYRIMPIKTYDFGCSRNSLVQRPSIFNLLECFLRAVFPYMYVAICNLSVESSSLKSKRITCCLTLIRLDTLVRYSGISWLIWTDLRWKYKM